MESKAIIGIFVALIIGVGSGYVLFDNSAEFNEALEDTNCLQLEYDTLEDKYNELSLEVKGFEADLSSLQEQYDELNENNVPVTQYDSLYEDYKESLDSIAELEAELAIIQTQYTELETTHNEFTQEYDDLLVQYQLVNSPASAYTDINDLEITLTTEKTIYNYTEPITGIVSIYYKTGEPFKGKVEFSIKTGSHGATTGYQISINGESNYYFGLPAFRYGPGIYTFQVGRIKDLQDYVIAGSTELTNTSIIIEAK